MIGVTKGDTRSLVYSSNGPYLIVNKPHVPSAIHGNPFSEKPYTRCNLITGLGGCVCVCVCVYMWWGGP